MKKISVILVLVVLFLNETHAQKIYTKEGIIGFHAGTKLEDIDATNSRATCIIDKSTGDMEWSVLVKGFKFKRALMEEHFNENYMESNTFPKATFKGKISAISDVKFGADGVYNVKVNGKLSIHGVTNDIATNGKIIVKNGISSVESKFNVVPEDYKIEIPSAVRDKIAKSVEITVSGNLLELKK